MSNIEQKNGKRFYNNLVNFYTESKNIIIDRNTAGYTITNLGDTSATVNGIPIFPGTPGTILGDSFTVMLNEMDIYRGNMELSFLTPLGAVPRVMIVLYVYMETEI